MPPDMGQPPLPADPARAAVGLEHWLDAARDRRALSFARHSLKTKSTRALLEGIFGGSPYLGQLFCQEFDLSRQLLEGGIDAAFASIEAEMESAARSEYLGLGAALRNAKRRAALTVAFADITGHWPVMRVH